MPGAKRSDRTRDRGVAAIGDAVEVRDDAANGRELLCFQGLHFQGLDSAHFKRDYRFAVSEPLFRASIIPVLHSGEALLPRSWAVGSR